MKDWLKRFGGAMDWPFNVSGRGKISDPFGDWDKDGVPNMNDCSPRNPKKQDKMTAQNIGTGFIQQEMKLNRSQPESVKIPDELRRTKAISLPVLPREEIPVKIGIPKDPNGSKFKYPIKRNNTRFYRNGVLTPMPSMGSKINPSTNYVPQEGDRFRTTLSNGIGFTEKIYIGGQWVTKTVW